MKVSNSVKVKNRKSDIEMNHIHIVYRELGRCNKLTLSTSCSPRKWKSQSWT